MSLRILVVSSQFGYPWDPIRAMFNQQQFDRLSKRVELKVLVPVPWPEVLLHPGRYFTAREDALSRWPYVDYFVYWYVPGFARGFNSVFMFASLLAQRMRMLLFRRWDCMLGSWLYPDAVALAMVGRLSRTPVVAKAHGSDVNQYTRNRGRRWQIREGLNRCDAVVTVSRALAERLREVGVEPRLITVIYNGVDETRFRAVPGGEADCGPDQAVRRILYVGNLLVSKGCADLLEAFALVARVRPGLRLTLVGEGDARAALTARAAALGLGDRVEFVGKIPHGDLAKWYGRAALMCLPSHNEGVPNVILEAMACGTPVVATRVGGIPEVLPEFAGLIVPAHDIPRLASAMEQALSSRWDRDRIVEHSRRFSWTANVDQLMAVLHRAAHRGATTQRAKAG